MLQVLRQLIDQNYKVHFSLDSLPVTPNNLEEHPSKVYPGYQIGYTQDGMYYVNNHSMLKILVHQGRQFIPCCTAQSKRKEVSIFDSASYECCEHSRVSPT